jgi:hypothetical protein
MISQSNEKESLLKKINQYENENNAPFLTAS